MQTRRFELVLLGWGSAFAANAGAEPGAARFGGALAPPAPAEAAPGATTRAPTAAPAAAPKTEPTPAPTTPAPEPEPATSADASTCVPDCRAGYVCVEGKCVSACNPPCEKGEVCTAAGECVAKHARAAAPEASAAPPPPSEAPSSTESESESGGESASKEGEPRGYHDGFYLRLGLGLGYAAGSGQSETITSVYMGQPLEDQIEASLGGFAVSTELALGGSVAPGIIIGGGSYVAFIPSLAIGAKFSGTDADFTASASVAMIGPFIDYYFDPAEGFHGSVALTYSLTHVSKSKESVVTENFGERYFPSSDVSGSGFGLVAGFGDEWWVSKTWSLGLLGRVQWIPSASLKYSDGGEAGSVSLFIPTLMLSATMN